MHNFTSTVVVNTDAALVLGEQSPKLSKSSSTVKDEQSFTDQSADEQYVHKKAKYIPPYQRNLHEQQQHARRGFSSNMYASYAYQPELGEYSHSGLHVLTQPAMIFPDSVQACDKQSPAMHTNMDMEQKLTNYTGICHVGIQVDTCHSYMACDVDVQCSFSSSKFDASTSFNHLLSHHEQMITSIISDEQSDMYLDLQLFLEEEDTKNSWSTISQLLFPVHHLPL